MTFVEWYSIYKRNALASIEEFEQSTFQPDVVRQGWIANHNAQFVFHDGMEAAALSCRSEDGKYEGWGDTARIAVDSAIVDHLGKSKGIR